MKRLSAFLLAMALAAGLLCGITGAGAEAAEEE